MARALIGAEPIASSLDAIPSSAEALILSADAFVSSPDAFISSAVTTTFTFEEIISSF